MGLIMLGGGLPKQEPLDLKHIFIMKISEKCLWNDEGAGIMKVADGGVCHP